VLLRFLLLQARHHDDPMLARERRSFAEHLDVPEEQVVPLNLLDGPVGPADLERGDALLIGGSGDYYVSKDHLPHAEAVFDLLREVAARGFPTFASCFGFQLLVRALGGEIVHDPQTTEVGTLDLALTAEGRCDPLLGQLPERFAAQLGRKDRAARMPPGVPNLAASDLNPHQALRLPGRPVWATQFHPELTAEENRARFERYLAGYAGHMSDEEREAALARFRPSPEANSLLRRFVRLVFG
jgi:GMP synthase (glutamine-hydrolysing)